MNFYEEEISNIVTVLKRDCHGVVLHTRGRYDPHLCFQYITEDDGAWSPMKNGSGYGCSSSWIFEMLDLHQEVFQWLYVFGEREENGHGWRIKK